MSHNEYRRQSTVSHKTPETQAIKRSPMNFVSKLKKSYTNLMTNPLENNMVLNSPVKVIPQRNKTINVKFEDDGKSKHSKNSKSSKKKLKSNTEVMPQISQYQILNKENILLKNSIKDFLKLNNNTVSMIDKDTEEVKFTKIDTIAEGKLTRFASLIKTSIEIVEDRERREKEREESGHRGPLRRKTTITMNRNDNITFVEKVPKSKLSRGLTTGSQAQRRFSRRREVIAASPGENLSNHSQEREPPTLNLKNNLINNNTMKVPANSNLLSHPNLEDDFEIELKRAQDSKDSNAESLRLNSMDQIELKKTLFNMSSSIVINEPERDLIQLRNVYDSLSDEEPDIYGDFEYVIHPNSQFKANFDNSVYISFVYSVITLPIFLAFIKEKCHSIFTRFTLTFFDVIIDLIFIADFILSFFTGYYDFEENVIYSKKKIAENYALSYMLFDLASALPFCSFINLNILGDINLRWLKIFRLAKFAKVMCKKNHNGVKYSIFSQILKNVGLGSILKKTKHGKISRFQISSKYLKLLRYTVIFVIICHVFTGIWMYMALLSPGINWTSSEGMEMTCDNLGNFYLASMYFTMVTFFTVGYGDIHPRSIIEKCYSVVILLLAMILYSFAVSFLSNFALYQSTREKELEKNINYLQEVSFNHGIPYEMYKSILDYLRYSFQSNKTDNNDFLFGLPTTLRNELICEMYKDIIKNFKFFKNKFSQDSIAKIIMAMRPVIAYKGEEIIQEKSFVEEIVFVRSGRLCLICTYKKVVIRLLEIAKHEHFGDFFMINNKRSPVSLTVRSRMCDMFLLRKADLESIPYFMEIYSDVFKKSSHNMKRIYFIVKKNKIAVHKRMKMAKLPKINNFIKKMEDPQNNNSNSNNYLPTNITIINNPSDLKEQPANTHKFNKYKTIQECQENEEISLNNDFTSRRVEKKITNKTNLKEGFEYVNKGHHMWNKLETEMKSDQSYEWPID